MLFPASSIKPLASVGEERLRSELREEPESVAAITPDKIKPTEFIQEIQAKIRAGNSQIFDAIEAGQFEEAAGLIDGESAPAFKITALSYLALAEAVKDDVDSSFRHLALAERLIDRLYGKAQGTPEFEEPVRYFYGLVVKIFENVMNKTGVPPDPSRPEIPVNPKSDTGALFKLLLGKLQGIEDLYVGKGRNFLRMKDVRSTNIYKDRLWKYEREKSGKQAAKEVTKRDLPPTPQRQTVQSAVPDRSKTSEQAPLPRQRVRADSMPGPQIGIQRVNPNPPYEAVSREVYRPLAKPFPQDLLDSPVRAISLDSDAHKDNSTAALKGAVVLLIDFLAFQKALGPHASQKITQAYINRLQTFLSIPTIRAVVIYNAVNPMSLLMRKFILQRGNPPPLVAVVQRLNMPSRSAVNLKDALFDVVIHEEGEGVSVYFEAAKFPGARKSAEDQRFADAVRKLDPKKIEDVRVLRALQASLELINGEIDDPEELTPVSLDAARAVGMSEEAMREPGTRNRNLIDHLFNIGSDQGLQKALCALWDQKEAAALRLSGMVARHATVDSGDIPSYLAWQGDALVLAPGYLEVVESLQEEIERDIAPDARTIDRLLKQNADGKRKYVADPVQEMRKSAIDNVGILVRWAQWKNHLPENLAPDYPERVKSLQAVREARVRAALVNSLAGRGLIWEELVLAATSSDKENPALLQKLLEGVLSEIQLPEDYRPKISRIANDLTNFMKKKGKDIRTREDLARGMKSHGGLKPFLDQAAWIDRFSEQFSFQKKVKKAAPEPAQPAQVKEESLLPVPSPTSSERYFILSGHFYNDNDYRDGLIPALDEVIQEAQAGGESPKILIEAYPTIPDVHSTIILEILKKYGEGALDPWLARNGYRLTNREKNTLVAFSREWERHYKKGGAQFILFLESKGPLVREGFELLFHMMNVNLNMMSRTMPPGQKRSMYTAEFWDLLDRYHVAHQFFVSSGEFVRFYFLRDFCTQEIFRAVIGGGDQQFEYATGIARKIVEAQKEYIKSGGQFYGVARALGEALSTKSIIALMSSPPTDYHWGFLEGGQSVALYRADIPTLDFADDAAQKSLKGEAFSENDLRQISARQVLFEIMWESFRRRYTTLSARTAKILLRRVLSGENFETGLPGEFSGIEEDDVRAVLGVIASQYPDIKAKVTAAVDRRIEDQLRDGSLQEPDVKNNRAFLFNVFVRDAILDIVLACMEVNGRWPEDVIQLLRGDRDPPDLALGSRLIRQDLTGQTRPDYLKVRAPQKTANAKTSRTPAGRKKRKRSELRENKLQASGRMLQKQDLEPAAGSLKLGDRSELREQSAAENSVPLTRFMTGFRDRVSIFSPEILRQIETGKWVDAGAALRTEVAQASGELMEGVILAYAYLAVHYAHAGEFSSASNTLHNAKVLFNENFGGGQRFADMTVEYLFGAHVKVYEIIRDQVGMHPQKGNGFISINGYSEAQALQILEPVIRDGVEINKNFGKEVIPDVDWRKENVRFRTRRRDSQQFKVYAGKFREWKRQYLFKHHREKILGLGSFRDFKDFVSGSRVILGEDYYTKEYYQDMQAVLEGILGADFQAIQLNRQAARQLFPALKTRLNENLIGIGAFRRVGQLEYKLHRFLLEIDRIDPETGELRSELRESRLQASSYRLQEEILRPAASSLKPDNRSELRDEASPMAQGLGAYPANLWVTGDIHQSSDNPFPKELQGVPIKAITLDNPHHEGNKTAHLQGAAVLFVNYREWNRMMTRHKSVNAKRTAQDRRYFDRLNAFSSIPSLRALIFTDAEWVAASEAARHYPKFPLIASFRRLFANRDDLMFEISLQVQNGEVILNLDPKGQQGGQTAKTADQSAPLQTKEIVPPQTGPRQAGGIHQPIPAVVPVIEDAVIPAELDFVPTKLLELIFGSPLVNAQTGRSLFDGSRQAVLHRDIAEMHFIQKKSLQEMTDYLRQHDKRYQDKPDDKVYASLNAMLNTMRKELGEDPDISALAEKMLRAAEKLSEEGRYLFKWVYLPASGDRHKTLTLKEAFSRFQKQGFTGDYKAFLELVRGLPEKIYAVLQGDVVQEVQPVREEVQISVNQVPAKEEPPAVKTPDSPFEVFLGTIPRTQYYGIQLARLLREMHEAVGEKDREKFELAVRAYKAYFHDVREKNKHGHMSLEIANAYEYAGVWIAEFEQTFGGRSELRTLTDSGVEGNGSRHVGLINELTADPFPPELQGVSVKAVSVDNSLYSGNKTAGLQDAVVVFLDYQVWQKSMSGAKNRGNANKGHDKSYLERILTYLSVPTVRALVVTNATGGEPGILRRFYGRPSLIAVFPGLEINQRDLAFQVSLRVEGGKAILDLNPKGNQVPAQSFGPTAQRAEARDHGSSELRGTEASLSEERRRSELRPESRDSGTPFRTGRSELRMAWRPTRRAVYGFTAAGLLFFAGLWVSGRNGRLEEEAKLRVVDLRSVWRGKKIRWIDRTKSKVLDHDAEITQAIDSVLTALERLPSQAARRRLDQIAGFELTDGGRTGENVSTVVIKIYPNEGLGDISPEFETHKIRLDDSKTDDLAVLQSNVYGEDFGDVVRSRMRLKSLKYSLVGTVILALGGFVVLGGLISFFRSWSDNLRENVDERRRRKAEKLFEGSPEAKNRRTRIYLEDREQRQRRRDAEDHWRSELRPESRDSGTPFGTGRSELREEGGIESTIAELLKEGYDDKALGHYREFIENAMEHLGDIDYKRDLEGFHEILVAVKKVFLVDIQQIIRREKNPRTRQEQLRPYQAFSRAYTEETLRYMKAWPGEYYESEIVQKEFAIPMSEWAQILRYLDLYDETIELLEFFVSRMKWQGNRYFEYHLLSAYSSKATAYYRNQQIKESRAAHRKAVLHFARWVKTVGFDNPDNEKTFKSLMTSVTEVSKEVRDPTSSGQPFAEAIHELKEVFLEIVPVQGKTASPELIDSIGTMINAMGKFWIDLGKIDEAESFVNAMAKHLIPTAYTLQLLARIAVARKNWDLAWGLVDSIRGTFPNFEVGLVIAMVRDEMQAAKGTMPRWPDLGLGETFAKTTMAKLSELEQERTGQRPSKSPSPKQQIELIIRDMRDLNERISKKTIDDARAQQELEKLSKVIERSDIPDEEKTELAEILWGLTWMEQDEISNRLKAVEGRRSELREGGLDRRIFELLLEAKTDERKRWQALELFEEFLKGAQTRLAVRAREDRIKEDFGIFWRSFRHLVDNVDSRIGAVIRQKIRDKYTRERLIEPHRPFARRLTRAARAYMANWRPEDFNVEDRSVLSSINYLGMTLRVSDLDHEWVDFFKSVPRDTTIGQDGRFHFHNLKAYQTVTNALYQEGKQFRWSNDKVKLGQLEREKRLARSEAVWSFVIWVRETKLSKPEAKVIMLTASWVKDVVSLAHDQEPQVREDAVHTLEELSRIFENVVPRVEPRSLTDEMWGAIGSIYSSLALYWSDKEEYGKAKQLTHISMGLPVPRIYALRNLARIAAKEGNFDQAENYIREIEKLDASFALGVKVMMVRIKIRRLQEAGFSDRSKDTDLEALVRKYRIFVDEAVSTEDETLWEKSLGPFRDFLIKVTMPFEDLFWDIWESEGDEELDGKGIQSLGPYAEEVARATQKYLEALPHSVIREETDIMELIVLIGDMARGLRFLGMTWSASPIVKVFMHKAGLRRTQILQVELFKIYYSVASRLYKEGRVRESFPVRIEAAEHFAAWLPAAELKRENKMVFREAGFIISDVAGSTRRGQVEYQQKAKQVLGEIASGIRGIVLKRQNPVPVDYANLFEMILDKIAQAWIELGELDRAEDLSRFVLELPILKKGYAFHNLALIAAHRGDFEGAEQIIARGKKEDPKFDWSRTEGAVSQIQLGGRSELRGTEVGNWRLEARKEMLFPASSVKPLASLSEEHWRSELRETVDAGTQSMLEQIRQGTYPAWLSRLPAGVAPHIRERLFELFNIPERYKTYNLWSLGHYHGPNGMGAYYHENPLTNRYLDLEGELGILRDWFSGWPEMYQTTPIMAEGENKPSHWGYLFAIRYGQILDYFAHYRRLIEAGVLEPQKVGRVLELASGNWCYAPIYPRLFPNFQKAFAIDHNIGGKRVFDKRYRQVFGLDPEKFVMHPYDDGSIRILEVDEKLQAFVHENGKFDLVSLQTFLPEQFPPGPGTQSDVYGQRYEAEDHYKLLVNISRLLTPEGKLVISFKGWDAHGSYSVQFLWEILKKISHESFTDWRVDQAPFGSIGAGEQLIFVLSQPELAKVEDLFWQYAEEMREKGERSHTIDAYERLLELHPERTDLYFYLGEAYTQIKSNDPYYVGNALMYLLAYLERDSEQKFAAQVRQNLREIVENRETAGLDGYHRNWIEEHRRMGQMEQYQKYRRQERKALHWSLRFDPTRKSHRLRLAHHYWKAGKHWLATQTALDRITYRPVTDEEVMNYINNYLAEHGRRQSILIPERLTGDALPVKQAKRAELRETEAVLYPDFVYPEPPVFFVTSRMIGDKDIYGRHLNSEEIQKILRSEAFKGLSDAERNLFQRIAGFTQGVVIVNQNILKQPDLLRKTLRHDFFHDGIASNLEMKAVLGRIFEAWKAKRHNLEQALSEIFPIYRNFWFYAASEVKGGEVFSQIFEPSPSASRHWIQPKWEALKAELIELVAGEDADSEFRSAWEFAQGVRERAIQQAEKVMALIQVGDNGKVSVRPYRRPGDYWRSELRIAEAGSLRLDAGENMPFPASSFPLPASALPEYAEAHSVSSESVLKVVVDVMDGVLPLSISQLAGSLLVRFFGEPEVIDPHKDVEAARRIVAHVDTKHLGAFVLGRDFALQKGGLEAILKLHPHIPIAVLVDDDELVAMLEKDYPDVLAVRNVWEAQSSLRERMRLADDSATRNKIAGVASSDELDVAELLQQVVDDVTVMTAVMFEKFRTFVGEQIAHLMSELESRIQIAQSA
ncbi:MAG: hypothetical protein JW893_05760 [Candidatus Omnitrophica bacterium]|nr:hypothetical protein [Candidatus Omnitrophota bacterium]